MQSEFSQDFDDPDQPIRDAFTERPGKPVKVRIQPMLLRQRAGKQGQYQSWKQVAWTLDCDTVDEASAMREAMRVFFETIGRCGPEAVKAALTKLVKEAAA